MHSFLGKGEFVELTTLERNQKKQKAKKQKAKKQKATKSKAPKSKAQKQKQPAAAVKKLKQPKATFASGSSPSGRHPASQQQPARRHVSIATYTAAEGRMEKVKRTVVRSRKIKQAAQRADEEEKSRRLSLRNLKPRALFCCDNLRCTTPPVYKFNQQTHTCFVPNTETLSDRVTKRAVELCAEPGSSIIQFGAEIPVTVLMRRTHNKASPTALPKRGIAARQSRCT